MKAKKWFIGAAFAALALFIVSVVMIAVSAVRSNEEMDLGIDLGGYNVTKMYTDNETERVAGTQKGEVFAFDMQGEKIWDIGALFVSPVYDIVKQGENVLVAYANGKIAKFNESDAVAFDPENGSFADKCIFYSAGSAFHASGNVKNTQMIVTADGSGFYLRGIFSGVNANNRIYRFAYDSETGEKLVATSNRLGGMAVAENGTLYYAMRSGVYTLNEEGRSVLVQDVNETISALSVRGGTLSAVTAQSVLVSFAADGTGTQKKVSVGESFNSDYVFSTGENFVAKIKNGGVAIVDSASGKITLKMRAADSSNLIMWTDESFVLYDAQDVNNPVVTYYSGEFARMRMLYSGLLVVFVVTAIVSLIAGAYFGFGIKTETRRKINGKFCDFFAELVRHKFIYLALVIPFALLIVFYYIPIVLGFGLSFFDYVPGVRLVFVQFKNFVSVALNARFWSATGTMIVFLIADLLKAVIPPLFVAEAICAVKFKRFSLVVRILLFLPGILPGVATTLVWSEGVFGSTSNSLMNALVGLFVPGFAKNWIYSASNATAIGSMIAFGFPWVGSYLIFYGAITGINASVFEAAKLDGCGWWRRMASLDIPLIFPQIKYIVITAFIASVQNYTSIYILHGVDGQIQTPALLVYREIINANYGVASVMGLFIFAFLSVCTALNFKMQMNQE